METSTIRNLLFTGLLFLICSCRYGKEDTGEQKMKADCEVSFSLQDRQKQLRMSEFVDSVQEIPLEAPEDVMIGRPGYALFHDSHIFVVDNQQQKIFHFGDDGKYLGQLDKRGNGAGEYQSISICMAKGDTLYVFDNAGQNILLYDFSFRYLRSIRPETWVDYLYLLPDGSFLCFTPEFIMNTPNGIWQMDADGKVMKVWHEYCNEAYPSVSSSWKPFYATSSDGIGIRCPIRNEFYRFKDDSLSCVMRWKVKEKTTLSFPGVETCMYVKESFWICPIFVDADAWTFAIWSEYNGETSQLFSLYSKRTGKMSVAPSLVIDVGKMPFMSNPVSSNLPNAMVGIVDDNVRSAHEEYRQNELLLSILIYHFRGR